MPVIMPVIGKFTGGIDLVQQFTALAPIPASIPHTLEAVRKAGIPVLAWGNFANVVMNFVILAFVVDLGSYAGGRRSRALPRD